MEKRELWSSEFDSPLDLARPIAEEVRINSDFDPAFHKENSLPYLDKVADDQNLFGVYFVQTGRGISIPAAFDADEEVRVWDMNCLTFEGQFATHSLIQIGRLNDLRVRALCLSFSEALLLPYFDEIPDEHILHVPVLAIDDMSRTQ